MIKTIVQHQFAIHTGVEGHQWKSSIQGTREAAGYHCSASSWLPASTLFKSSSPSVQRAASGTSRSGTTIQTESHAHIGAVLTSPSGFRSRLLPTPAGSSRGQTPTVHGTAIRVRSNQARVAQCRASTSSEVEGAWFNSRPEHRFGGVAQLARAPHRPASPVDEEVGVFESLRLRGRYNGSAAGSSVVERPASIAKLGGARFNSCPADGQPGRDNSPRVSEPGFQLPSRSGSHLRVSLSRSPDLKANHGGGARGAGWPTCMDSSSRRALGSSKPERCGVRSPLRASSLGSSTGMDESDQRGWIEALQSSEYVQVLK